MNHLLIEGDPETKLPNLALMKLSAWAKSRGDHVELNHATVRPDEVWISCLFTWNREHAYQIGAFWESMGNPKIHFGGTGFDWHFQPGQRINLPAEIELIDPDYDLYQDDRAVGFSIRGCDRYCIEFCDVPLKEGRINPSLYKSPRDWVPDRFNKVLELANDISLPSIPKWMHDDIILSCAETGRKLSITQGYDIRCVTEEKAALLAEHKPYSYGFDRKCLYIAWDRMSTEKAIRRNIPILLDAGFKGREITCYMVSGSPITTFEQDLYKFKILWEEFGVYPYVMAFNDRHDLPWLNAFRRYVNYRIFKSPTCKTWEDYRRSPDYNEKPDDQQMPLVFTA